MTKSRTVLIASVLLLSGCASALTVTQISNDLPAGSSVNGVPFRVPQQYKLTVYQRTDAGYQKVHDQEVTLPDQDRLYVLGFKSQPLSNATVEFKLNNNNTLQEVKLKSDSKGADAMTEVTAQLKAIQAADEAAATADKADETAVIGKAISADKAYQAATEAELAYETLTKDAAATPDALLKAQNKARSAKLDANEAARLAGKPPYFPDIVP